ncbi:hypothetical protein AX17_001672 [Amanita inopinata Kibby_2008]|nr:hypothetical protein AX17_001672 [Amanita inopinata Kibby_2008]
MAQVSQVEPDMPLLFAPNVTPGTFMKPQDLEPLKLPHSESMLFPCSNDYPPTRRYGHSKRKAEDHIPRPPNAFILFRSSFIRNQHVSAEVETDHSTLSKIIGLTWQNMPEEERQVWHEKARLAKEEHRRKFPQYTFRPILNKAKTTKLGKRSIREVCPKDLKRCAKIAELLVEGKKGGELDAAMQEFDRHHVPEFVTKFEEPITAQVYARSSSAPAPDITSGDHLAPASTRSAAPPKKKRALSVQPTIPTAPLTPSASISSLDGIGAQVVPPTPFNQEPIPDAPLAINTYANHGLYPLPSSLGPTNVCPVLQPPIESAMSPCDLFVNTSFANLDAWQSCSSPASDAPSTPLLGAPLESPIPLHPMQQQPALEYFDSTQLHSFDLSLAKSFVDYSRVHVDVNHYSGYPHPEALVPFANQSSCGPQVQMAPFDFDFSAFIPMHGSL